MQSRLFSFYSICLLTVSGEINAALKFIFVVWRSIVGSVGFRKKCEGMFFSFFGFLIRDNLVSNKTVELTFVVL